MSNEFIYKGYSGSCETSIEDECLVGRILFIDDLIVYEGNTIAELKASFEAAVDRYVEYCANTGRAPNKPYSGNFNVRINKDVHKASAQCAQRAGISLNQFVGRALDHEIKKENKAEVVRHEVTVNHVVNHEHHTVAVPYDVKEPIWQRSQKSPIKKIAAKPH